MPSAASSVKNPWLESFLSEPWTEITLGQVHISRASNTFTLRHISPDNPKPIQLSELRALVNFTAEKKFRPLKSTPDLRNDWLLHLKSPEELEAAVQTIYPNALPDLFSLQVTDYRSFTNRQTGMYRITTFLNDSGVENLIREVCETICLKKRLWPVSASSVRSVPSCKVCLPCLEPCAIFLEAARKKVRAQQAESSPPAASPPPNPL